MSCQSLAYNKNQKLRQTRSKTILINKKGIIFTALRGAATLRATLQKGYGSVQGNSVETSTALNFVFVGGELLKRTRKGTLRGKRH